MNLPWAQVIEYILSNRLNDDKFLFFMEHRLLLQMFSGHIISIIIEQAFILKSNKERKDDREEIR